MFGLIFLVVGLSTFSFIMGALYGAESYRQHSMKVFSTFYNLMVKEFGDERVKKQALMLDSEYNKLSQKKSKNN